MGTRAKSYLTAEIGTKIFAFVNMVITTILLVTAISVLTLIALIVWLQPNLSKNFAYLNSLNHIWVALLLIVQGLAAEVCAILLLRGVFRKRPSLIYIYLVYGVPIVIFTLIFDFTLLCSIVEIPEAWNKTFVAKTFIVSGVYLFILVMIRRTYKKYKNEQAVKTKDSSLKV